MLLVVMGVSLLVIGWVIGVLHPLLTSPRP